jgi:hypothetical protein
MSLTIHLRSQETLTVKLAKVPCKVLRTDKKTLTLYLGRENYCSENKQLILRGRTNLVLNVYNSQINFISLSNKINFPFKIYLQESFPRCSVHLYILFKNVFFSSFFCHLMIATGLFRSSEFYVIHIFLGLPTSSCSWEYIRTPTATQEL